MSKTLPLESTMEELFIKKAPALPQEGKKFLVVWAPFAAVILGIISLGSAFSLWRWAHAIDRLGIYTNALCRDYDPAAACNNAAASRFSLWLWLAIAFLLVEGILYLVAFPGLRDHKKQGWNYLYYGALVNLVYAVISLFTSYDVVGHFIGALIGSAIGFYLLFQIRSAYGSDTAPMPPSNNGPLNPIN